LDVSSTSSEDSDEENEELNKLQALQEKSKQYLSPPFLKNVSKCSIVLCLAYILYLSPRCLFYFMQELLVFNILGNLPEIKNWSPIDPEGKSLSDYTAYVCCCCHCFSH
jgi:hypothetical protein